MADQKEKPKGNGLADADGSAEQDAAEEAAEAQLAAEAEEIGRLADEVARLKDRHLRLAAEFDNYRKRSEREKSESHTRAQAELASRLLDGLDDLQRVAHHADAADFDTLLDGVRLVERKLLQVLEASGLEPVDAEGRPFDPESIEALATVEAESAAEDDHVADVFQRGYRFKGQLIRPARVRVKQYEA